MKLREWVWEQQAFVEVEYPDGPIQEFMNYLWEGKQWKERPELVYNRFRQLQERLLAARHAAKVAAVKTATASTVAAVPASESPAGFVCDQCGKVVKTALALSGHKRSHKKAAA